jgi:hypothetical protein
MLEGQRRRWNWPRCLNFIVLDDDDLNIPFTPMRVIKIYIDVWFYLKSSHLSLIN